MCVVASCGGVSGWVTTNVCVCMFKGVCIAEGHMSIWCGFYELLGLFGAGKWVSPLLVGSCAMVNNNRESSLIYCISRIQA